MAWLNTRKTAALVAALTVGAVDSATAAVLGQSPIDITASEVVIDPNFKPLVFNYSSAASLTVKNINSPDVEGTIRGIPAAGSTLSFGGNTYDLTQFHFHIGSEHEVNGYQAPMEIHFVNQKQESSGTGDLLVVGRFIEIGPTNTVLAPFFSGISFIPSPDNSFDLTSFDISALLPVEGWEYRYSGSLTTAPYTEGVNWNVFFGTPLYLSQMQIDEFATVFPAGNAREIQALDGRIITTNVPEIDPNSFGSAFAPLAGSLALLERRKLKSFGLASVA